MKFSAPFDKGARLCADNDFFDLLHAAALLPERWLLVDSQQREINRATFTGAGGIDLARLALVMKERSASLVLDSVQDFSPAVFSMADQIAEAFNARVWVNAYFSPFATSTFGWHWDDHDVLVYQVSGKKDWNVFAPAVQLPIAEQASRNVPYRFDGKLRQFDGFRLEQGDFAYVPRGFGHIVQPRGHHSLHLTFGIRPLSYHELISQVVEHALATARTEVAFRRSVSFDQNRLLTPSARNTVDRLCRRLGALMKEEGVPAIRLTGNRLGRPAMEEGTRPFREMLAPSRFDDDTVFLRTEKPITFRTVPLLAQVEVSTGTVKTVVPAGCEQFLRFAQTAMQLTVADATVRGVDARLAQHLVYTLWTLGLLQRDPQRPRSTLISRTAGHARKRGAR